MPIAIHLAALLALAACASTTEEPPETQQRLSCEYQHHPCNPLDFSSEWECSTVCGYTAHCRDYTWLEELDCAKHPNQVVSLVPYRWCNWWGSPTWDTWCEPTFISAPPTEQVTP